MSLPVITIGREFGSGGRLIGKKVAEELGIPFYDREIISMTARRSGFAHDIIEKAENTRPQSIIYTLFMTSQELPLADQVFITESKIILELAGEGPCVIVGRCADYTLRDSPKCLRTFICAPIEERVARARDTYGVDVENLESFVQKEDKRRASYYNYFTPYRWGAGRHYHMILSSSLGLDLTARLIIQAARAGSGQPSV